MASSRWSNPWVSQAPASGAVRLSRSVTIEALMCFILVFHSSVVAN
jgi:hypothetical protein